MRGCKGLDPAAHCPASPPGRGGQGALGSLHLGETKIAVQFLWHGDPGQTRLLGCEAGGGNQRSLAQGG